MSNTRLISGSMLFAMTLGMSVALADDDHNDREFVAEAASGGQMEVRIGNYAAKNGDSDAVRDFGKQMEQDHSKVNDELKAVAAHDSIDVPSDLNVQDHEALERLKKMKGRDFDRAYIQQMVQAHEQDIAAFQNEASNGRNDRVRDFAQRELPLLQHHLQMAEDIDRHVEH